MMHRSQSMQQILGETSLARPAWNALALLFTSQIWFKWRQKGQDAVGNRKEAREGAKGKRLRALSFCRLSPTHIISRAQADSRGFKHL